MDPDLVESLLNRLTVTVIVGIIVIIFAISLNYVTGPSDEDAAPVISEKSSETVTAPAPEQKHEPMAPSFDVVRVNPNGDAVMAGRAEPSSDVDIINTGADMGHVTTDSRGEWVFVPEQPLEPGEHRLSLIMRLDGKEPVKSLSDVVLVVPERDKNIAGQSGSGQTLALRIGKDGKATVMQKPGGSGGKLSVDAVDYDAQGRLFISGHAEPGGTVQIYLNNRFIGHARAGEDTGAGSGIWTVSPESPVAPGLYTLRADHVDNAGKVLARVQFPFSRADPINDVAMKQGDFITVQPGNSLWRLARSTYGVGTRYTVIYQANKDQITNPDLIYPGQRFKVPQTN